MDDGDFYYDPDIIEFGDEFGFSDDPTAMQLFYEGYLTSSDPESSWYNEEFDPDSRHEARQEFEDYIDDNYPDFDWEIFWEVWEDLYGNA